MSFPLGQWAVHGGSFSTSFGWSPEISAPLLRELIRAIDFFNFFLSRFLRRPIGFPSFLQIFSSIHNTELIVFFQAIISPSEMDCLY
jgi:hypothetical protein